MAEELSENAGDRGRNQPQPSEKYISQGAFSNRYSGDDPELGTPSRPGDLGALGTYRVLKELGRGGMGVVYHGYDDKLNRDVAIKMMLPKFAADAVAKSRFTREARAVAALTHDHIVTIHFTGEHANTPFLVMQLLDGVSLEEYQKEKKAISLRRIRGIGMQIALGLAAAHKVGLIHRDIKPANIYLEGSKRRVKILDFGLVKPTVEDPNDEQNTGVGEVMGTPSYMAPEQARGGDVDHRADLFSLGVILYRLTTGQLPFKAESRMGTLLAVMNDEPKPVEEINPDVPREFSRLISQLMAKRPNDRPKSAEEVASRIRQMEIESRQGDSVEQSGRKLGITPTKGDADFDPFADIEVSSPNEVIQRPEGTAASEPWPKWVYAALAVCACTILAIVVSQIARMGTFSGTLQIESVDQATVNILQGDKTILEKVGTGLHRLPVGQYTAALTEPKSEYKLSPTSFEITREGLAPLKVRKVAPFVLIPKKPPERVVMTPDRRAAEKLLPFCSLSVAKAGEEPRKVGGPGDLPNEAFTIYSIHLEENATLQEFSTILVPLMSELQSVVEIGDRSEKLNPPADVLKKLLDTPSRTTLKHLTLSGCEFEATHLEMLKSLPQLEFLHFNGRRVPTEAFALLRDLRKLRSLSVLSLPDVSLNTREFFRVVGTLPLVHLHIRGRVTFDLESSEYLGSSTTLAELYLFTGDLPVDCVRAICKIKSLVHLILESQLLTDAEISIFQQLTSLKVVSLNQTAITEAGAKALAAKLPQCEIKYNGGIITPEGSKLGGLIFDGKSTAVRIPTLNYDGKLPITIEAWITPETVTGKSRHIFLFGEPGGGLGLSNQGNLGVGFFNGTEWIREYGNVVPNKKLVHVATVITANRYLLYIDGKNAGKLDVNLEKLPTTKPPALIGVHPANAPEGYFHGTIHALRITKGELYPRSFTPAAMLTKEESTIALYQFNDAQGAKLTDSSGHEHHGVVENGTWATR